MKLILGGNIARRLYFTLQTGLKLIQPLNLPFRNGSDLPVPDHKDTAPGQLMITLWWCVTNRLTNGGFHMQPELMCERLLWIKCAFFREWGPAMEARLLRSIFIVASRVATSVKTWANSKLRLLKVCNKSRSFHLILKQNLEQRFQYLCLNHTVTL